mmetsp:Transcript_70046/g.167333  ORF Transcript_70046/g.167333 Transcript_70046/m.167333 type:complete len:251 (+) Transcript_70046:66-818(+)
MRVRRALPVYLAVGSMLGACFLSASRSSQPRSSRTSLRAKAAYPELSALEDRIYESCLVKDVDEEVECMDVYGQLVDAHFKAQQDCDVDPSKCALLKVLDRLSWGTAGSDGLLLLQQLRESVEAIYQMFQFWNDAFLTLDTDGDGALSEEEFRSALRETNPNISDMTSGRLFRAADVNQDGFVDVEEFSDFLKAGAIAAESLQSLAPSHHHTVSSEQLVMWAMRGNLHQDGRDHTLQTAQDSKELADMVR